MKTRSYTKVKLQVNEIEKSDEGRRGARWHKVTFTWLCKISWQLVISLVSKQNI